MSKLNKPRLGRGLSSLISVSEGPDDLVPAPSMLTQDTSVQNESSAHLSTVDETERVLQLAVGDIRPNPKQPRRDFVEASLQELAASLKANGMIQPVVVRQGEQGYELIAGERRLRAAKLAGLSHIPAILKAVDGMSQAQLALVENIQREDLNPVDRAKAYKALLSQLGLSHGELATRLGEDRSTISNHLRLLDLTNSVLESLAQGKISLGHAKVLAGVADVLEQQRLANLVISQGLSVRNLERLLQAPNAAANRTANPASSAHLRSLEQRISGQLGMQVDLRSKERGKGKLIIHYASLDQFDELMGRLKVEVNEES